MIKWRYRCFILILWLLPLFAQGEHPFSPGEKVEYDVYYNVGFLWFNSAKVTFSVTERNYHGVQVYRFFSTGITHSNYDWFFMVRDTFVSYADRQTLLPYFAQRNTLEGGYRVNDLLFFNYFDKTINAKLYNSKRGARKKTFTLTDTIFDLLTAVYYCRAIDYSNLLVNQTVPIRAVVDDSVYNLYIRYLGKEQITLRNGEKYLTHKISAKLIEGTIFRSGEDLLVWFTADNAKIPLVIDAKILVGSVKAYLKATTELKHPIQAGPLSP